MTPTEPDDRAGAPTVGLIGLGLLGAAIAERLLRAGYGVVGYDLAAERREAFAGVGGTVGDGVTGVVGSCERVVLSLPSHENVAEVVRGADGVLRAGQTVIDTSTGDPRAAVGQAAYLARRGVAYVDAAVSGSSQQLRDGEATLLVGATDGAFEGCRDLFAALAASTVHTGPPGSGARMKLVTNLVLGLNRAALAEGLAFAEAVGVDPSAALAALRGSMAYSRAIDAKGQKMVDGDFRVQARLSQHLKDVRLVLGAAAEAGLTLPLSETHRALLERAEAAGWGDLDNSAVIRVIRGARS